MKGNETTSDEQFKWEEASESHNFFNDEEEEQGTVSTEDLIKAVETQEEEEDGTKKPLEDIEGKEKGTEEEDKKHAFFDDNAEEEEEEEEDKGGEDGKTTPKTKSPKTQKIGSAAQLEYLKEQGLVDYTLDEDEEMNDQLASEIIEDAWEDQFDAKLEEEIKAFPDSIKNLIRHNRNGGNVDELLASYAQPHQEGITKDLDMDIEANQIKVLKNAGKEDEYIEFLKESGKLKSMADTAFETKLAKDEERDAAIIKSKAENVKKARDSARLYRAEVTKHVQETENLNGLPFTKKDATVLPAYIADKTVETQSGKKISPLIRDIQSALEDKDKTLLLAKVLSSNFDFTSIEREEKSKAARGVKRKVQNVNKKEANKTGSSRTRRSRSTKGKQGFWDNL